MSNVRIGIPRGIHYYYYSKFWQYFFDSLGVELVFSPKTNKEILDKGIMIAPDEMCLSMKIYLGHVDYLKDKCDYILIPRIDRYSDTEQTCTNFLAIYDLVNNLFNINILNYNIDNKNNLLDGLISIGHILKKSRIKVIQAYDTALIRYNKYLKRKRIEQNNILRSKDKKVLLVGHPYNMYDEMVGEPITKIFRDNNIKVLYSDLFDSEDASILVGKISPNLYWKYSRENIGAIVMAKNVDGIVFLSSFPCGLDSLVNEVAIRKIDKPYLNLIVDDINSLTGIETRIESFVDIIG